MRGFVFAAVALAALGALPIQASARSTSCITWRTQSVPNGSGYYNHLVVIDNRCGQGERCSVRMDAGPPKAVYVLARQHAAVRAVGAVPAQGFRAIVTCSVSDRGQM